MNPLDLPRKASRLLGPVNVTDAAADGFNALLLASQIFSQELSMIVSVTPASSEGRYREDGAAPTVTDGLSMPAGGGDISIDGLENMLQFKLIATTGGACEMWAQTFRKAAQ